MLDFNESSAILDSMTRIPEIDNLVGLADRRT